MRFRRRNFIFKRRHADRIRRLFQRFPAILSFLPQESRRRPVSLAAISGNIAAITRALLRMNYFTNFTRSHQTHRTRMTRLLLALALCLLAPALPAQVIINEISAANLNGLTDGDGDREDWVELYNSSPVAVNIGGWFLSDNPAKPQKWVIPSGQTIGAGGYRIIFCSGKDKVAGAYVHTNFKITQTKGESVVLTQPNGATADSYTFTTPNQVNHSYGRAPNGGPLWKIYNTPTPGAANGPASFQSYAPAVSAAPNAGFYAGNTAVSLSTSVGFDIRYTTNGSEPTAASPLYSGPVNISATTVLKARAFSSNAQILPGFVTVNTYFINVNHTIPVISIAGDNLLNLLNGAQSSPFGSFEYFENNALKDEAYGEFNKHGNDSWAYPQRGIDWITRDQMGYKDELKYKFFKERSRNKFQRLILKAAANDNYPTSGGAHIRDSYVQTLALHGGMDLDVRTHRSCVVYVNGQYWGVYDMREKVDDADFTSYYYDQDEQDIDYIKTWGATWNEYGSSTDWYALKAFILGNNMAIPANYDYVQQQFDLLSLVDYVIINQHSVCKDWLNWNTSWWRGRNPAGQAKRWRYTLWDMDATFGHYINYTGIPNIGATADPCDVEQIPNSGDPQNHIDIFVALSANPQFRDMYINRYADLLNTSLSCQYMNALLDSMTNTIAPEMAQHCARWGGTVGQWNQNVGAIHNFINTRCQVIDQSIVDCYGVTGPFALTVKISPAASPNQVKVNTITPATYPFTGNYFGGVNIDLTAKPAPGWQFDHWEISGNTFGPDQNAADIAMAFQATGMATAFFVPTGPCTEPTGLTLTGTLPSPSMNWVGQPFSSHYLIKYRKTGDPSWTEITTTQTVWNFDTLPGCSNYEVQIQSVCPQGSSAFTDFAFATPDHLLGFDLADAIVCNSNIAVLDATVSGATYQWDDGSSAPTRSVTAPGKYWVRVESGGCTTTDTASVSFVDATASIQAVLCPGETFQVGSETFDEQHPSGQVMLGNIATNACDSIVNVSLQFLAPVQSYFYQKSCDPAAVGVDTLVLTSAAGCDSLVVTTTTLAPFSQTFLSASSCNPALVGVDTLVLTNHFGCDSLVITTVTFTGLDFETSAHGVLCFNGKDGFIKVDTVLTPWLPVEVDLGDYPARMYTGKPLVWENLPAGVYSLSATNSAGCTMTREIDVSEGNALHLDLGQQPVVIHFGDSLWVEPVADFQIAAAEWTPSDGVRCPLCPATFISAGRTGKYTLTVSDPNGCSTSASLAVRVEQGVRVYVANAIRPGSGGPNADLTIFTGPEVGRIRMLQVFDRWGNKLFEQKDLAPNVPSAWDGTFRGKPVNPGVVFWACEIETTDGRVVNLSGDITVLR